MKHAKCRKPRPIMSAVTRVTIGIALFLVATGAGGCRNNRTGTPQSTTSLARPAAIETYITGAQALDHGETDKAAQQLASAVRANPNLVMARIMLGQIYVERASYGDAEEQYQVLTRLDPYTASNFYGLGLSSQFLSKLKQSEQSYLRAIELDPKEAKSCANLGAVYLSLNRADDAVIFLQRATELDPDSWYAWQNLGIALDRKGQFKLAESAYRKSLELNSSQNSTMYNLASNLVTQGRGIEAMSWFEQLLKRDDTARYHKRYADAMVVARRLDDAAAEYRAALRLDSRYYAAMNELGLLLITQYKKEMELDDDKKRAAVDLWQQSLAIAPEQARVQEWLKEWGPRR